MKNLTLCILLLCLPIRVIAQEDYKLIEKAKISVKYGNLKKAERLLQRARVANYGFCGNAWFSALEQIRLVQSDIYIKQKEYDRALINLDSITNCNDGDCNERDSLKTVALIAKFGKDKVKAAFDKIVSIDYEHDLGVEHYGKNFIYLTDLNYRFYIYIDYRTRFVISEKSDTSLLEKIKKCSFYKLLE